MRFILILFFLCACAPATQQTLDLRFDREYEQHEREVQFAEDTRRCDLQTHIMVIERYGKATRNQVIRNVPGRGDTWVCANRTYL